jgi:hypothetical protein
MSNEEIIVNKVASSGLITINLDEWLNELHIEELDIAPWLWQGLALREKEFREHVSAFKWDIFQGKTVAVFCSNEAIIPTWAYMLVASALANFTDKVYFGSRKEVIENRILNRIASLTESDFKDGRVIIKGCSSFAFSPNVYMALVVKLKPVVKSIMFGEPCSTVPVYKRSNI